MSWQILFVEAGVATAAFYAIGQWARWLKASADKETMFAAAADNFYRHADELLSDKDTPQAALEFLNLTSKHLGDPRLVRRLVFRGLRGRIRDDLQHPTQEMRDFMRDISRMPERLRSKFGLAMSSALVLSALRAGLIGELFLRLMLPDPERQRETSTTYAAEMHGACTV